MSRTRSRDILIIPTITEGTTTIDPYELGPGVIGIAMWDPENKDIWISYINAKRKGVGDVGRFLDRCPDNVVFCTVVNKIFAGMLGSRGWRARMELIEEVGEETDVWRKEEA